jgi:arsenate reductase-like glutaredoxin family protein
MAMEARKDLNRKHLAHISKASEGQRQEIMRIKAEKYEKLKRGEYGDLTEKELAEATVDVSPVKDCWSNWRLKGRGIV